MKKANSSRFSCDIFFRANWQLRFLICTIHIQFAFLIHSLSSQTISKLKKTVILWKSSISVQNISFRLLISQDQINDPNCKNFQEYELHLSTPRVWTTSFHYSWAWFWTLSKMSNSPNTLHSCIYINVQYRL